jgi:long-chain-fatty-acid--CoA ligase ACSBG
MEIRTSDLNQLVKIIRSDGDMEPISVIDYFRRVVEKHPEHDALVYKGPHGLWIKISYAEYHRQVEKMAKILIKMGLKRRGVVAILAWNSPQWVITALAAIHAG